MAIKRLSEDSISSISSSGTLVSEEPEKAWIVGAY
jgi:hypothetical protein